jgi:hypothetical protein
MEKKLDDFNTMVDVKESKKLKIKKKDELEEEKSTIYNDGSSQDHTLNFTKYETQINNQF